MNTSRERRSASGPARHMNGRVDEVLDAVDRHGRRLAGEIENALDAQHLVAMPVEQHGQPDAEGRPVERFVEGERKGVDRAPCGASAEPDDASAPASSLRNEARSQARSKAARPPARHRRAARGVEIGRRRATAARPD